MKNGNSRKRTFAILSEIVEIDSEKFWKFIKKFYAIKSRKELSEKQWRSIADRLDAAKRDKDVLDKLLTKLDEMEPEVEEEDVQLQKEWTDEDGVEYKTETVSLMDLMEQSLDQVRNDGVTRKEIADQNESLMSKIKDEGTVIITSAKSVDTKENSSEETIELNEEHTVFPGDGIITDPSKISFIKEDDTEVIEHFENIAKATTGADLGLIDTEIEVDLEPKDIRDHFLKTHKDEIKGYIGCGFSDRSEKYGIRVYVEDKEESGIHDMKSYMKIPVTVVDSGEFHHWLGKGIHGLNQDALEVKINA